MGVPKGHVIVVIVCRCWTALLADAVAVVVVVVRVGVARGAPARADRPVFFFCERVELEGEEV